MAEKSRLLVSLIGSALFAAAIGAGAAYAAEAGATRQDGVFSTPISPALTAFSAWNSCSSDRDDDDDYDRSGSSRDDDDDYETSGGDVDHDDYDNDVYDSDESYAESDEVSGDSSGSDSGGYDNSGSGSYDSGSNYEPGSDSSGSGSGGSNDNSGSGSYDSGSNYETGSDASGSGSGGGNDNSGSGSYNSGSNDESGSDSSSGSSGSGSNSGSSSSNGDDESHSGRSGSASGVHNNDGDHGTGHIYAVERDESGHEYVRGEVLMTAAGRDLDAARGAGFALISQTPLGSINASLVRLQVPEGMSITEALTTLHRLAPEALVTPNDVYRHSQSFISGGPISTGRRRARLVGTLGIVDTGVDVAALPVAGALLSQRAFAGPHPVARQHGSVVAALAVGHGMRVHVADVFGESTDGALAASAESIAAALDWLLAANVPVINVSIEGPDNAVLRELVRRAAQRGHVIVAAAGNGGPMARPAYPAAFEGAIAVTAIDNDGHPYLRANRGDYISFAAPGVDVSVPTGETSVMVSGTSFAAPLISASIAASMRAPSLTQARDALSALRERAVDLGAPGRDPIYGWGAVRD